MKKSIFTIAAAFLMVLALSSCGEKLLTDAEVNAKIEEGVAAQEQTIKDEMEANCQETFDARVETEVARMVSEAAAAETVQ